MITIRKHTFETNSSSTHSITIYNDELVESELPIEDLDYDGGWEGNDWEPDCLMVELNGFCGWDDHESQNDRLALLCLLVCYEVMDNESPHCLTQGEWNSYFQEVYESDRWKELEEEIRNYVPNAKYIRVNQYSEGYIDHDSLWYDNYREFLNWWGFGSASSYVFTNGVKTHFEFCG